MKNLPRLPVEIWLMILKIKWQDRCNFLIAFHKSPRNIDYHQTEKLEFNTEDYNPKLANTEGWFEYYTMFNKTHIYCTLKYPKIRNTRYLHELIIQQMMEYYFHDREDFHSWAPIEWGDYNYWRDKKDAGLPYNPYILYTNPNYKKVKIKPNTVYYFGGIIAESKGFLYFNKI